MNAIVHREYGSADVLRCEEVDRPTPGANDVLVQVRAASVNPIDWHFMRGLPYLVRMMTGVGKPKTQRLGVDIAGRVDAVGANVTEFTPGDEVFGAGRGTFAEYAIASATALAVKPPTVTFEQGATVAVAALTALQALRDKVAIQPGQTVLVNGAAGGVGTFAVQLARSFGAEVTGVCSTRNADVVRSIGAGRVIDYTREDFTQRGERYDAILDCIGNHPLSALRRILTANGRYVGIGGPTSKWMIGELAAVLGATMLSQFTRKKTLVIVAKTQKADLALIGALIADGKVKPVIDRQYRLSDAASALRYVEEGHARGKVVITIPDAQPGQAVPE